MKPIIVTDSCADLYEDFYLKNDIPWIKLSYIEDGEIHNDDGTDQAIDAFYQRMREGATPSTSQVNMEQFYEFFRELLKTNRPIIYLGLSTGLSSTCASAHMAREKILEENQDADITIIDSVCVSGGLGLMIVCAVKMRDQGASKEEIVDWLRENNNKMNHFFTVSELTYLHRGGRISAASAVIGGMLDIRPLCYVDSGGFLQVLSKERGKKRLFKALLNKIEENIENPKDAAMYIAHGDCPADAEIIKEMILERLPIKTIEVGRIGSVIGSHVGPETMAIFFLGKPRL
ncbi:MAG: DegV family protein [Clostridiales bacterium]|nr:DegV family protein [Clostridiales bacterium]